MNRLVADAGGTNVRFAIADGSGGLTGARRYRVADFPTFGDALAAYRSDAGNVGTVSAAAIAAAGPVDDGRVKITNNPWSLDRNEIAALLGNVPVVLVNDLEAVAAALPHLPIADIPAFGAPPPVRPELRTMLALNVGTGLGAAAVTRRGARWWTCPSEAGHMTLGLDTADEIALLPKDATIESVLSGDGLARLYAALAGAPTSACNTAIVLARAGDDPNAARAVGLFTDVLGRIAGDLVLATCAWGGVYLCGSVAVAWSAIADIARFRAQFTNKGPMHGRMLQVPAAVIRRENVALTGLAMMPLSD